MTSDTSGVLKLQTASTDAVTIDASQNVGIGTSSSLTKLTLGSGTFRIKNASTDSNGMLLYQDTGDTSRIYNYYNGPLAFGTSNTERMRLDSSGNLGLGATPSAWTTFKVLQSGQTAYASSGPVALLYGNTYYDGTERYIITGTAARFDVNNSSSQPFRWYIAPSGTANTAITFTQAMTLDNSGNLLVGTTNSSLTVGAGVKMGNDGTDGWFGIVGATSANTAVTYRLYSTGAGAYRFYVGMGGTIYATSTSISAISDATLKENVRDLETGLTEVMALRPRRFDWKNGDAQNVAGFVAQEVEQVLPELVTDYIYNKDEDGNDIIKKSLKMGDILPTLVKAIQEQQQIIQSLTERITALEGAA